MQSVTQKYSLENPVIVEEPITEQPSGFFMISCYYVLDLAGG